jgi:hypothetical protein
MNDLNLTPDPICVNRDFKGIWIPREIWLNKKISNHAKLLWAEIHSLHDRQSGGCYASNDYLCEFLNIKITRLKEVMKELRDLGFLVDVSFDGRQRVMRAEMPITDYGGQQLAAIAASRVPEKRLADSRKSGTLPYIQEQSLEQSINSPLSPHPKKDEAKASEKKISDSLDPPPKKTKPSMEIPIEVQNLAVKLVKALQEANPHWIPPKNLYQLELQLHMMILNDNRTPEIILKVFLWAINDSFWMPLFSRPNPIKYLREKFSQIAGKMLEKPKANPNQVDRRLRDKDGNVSDEWKDNLF